MVCLFSSPEYAQLCFFCGTCVSLVTSHGLSVSFCIALCVVSALNFWGHSKQCLYFCCKVQAFAIFLEAVLKLFSQRTNSNEKQMKIFQLFLKKILQFKKNVLLSVFESTYSLFVGVVIWVLIVLVLFAETGWLGSEGWDGQNRGKTKGMHTLPVISFGLHHSPSLPPWKLVFKTFSN